MPINLPPYFTPTYALDHQSRERWNRHVAEFGIIASEQTSHHVEAALRRGDVDGALYAVNRARRQAIAAVLSEGAHVASIPGGSKRDEALAKAVSMLNAWHAEIAPESMVATMRESIFGKREPLTRPEAWAFLNRAERLPKPIAWERLHGGWDRSPRMRDTQIGEYATLSFRDEAGQDHQFRARPETVLATLWLWAEHLSLIYNWPRSQAAWFLLTGEAPTLPSLTTLIEQGVGGPLTSIITVSVLACGGDESVMTALRDARRLLLQRRQGPLALARYAMSEFVDAKLKRGGPRPTWAELWQDWDALAPPQWRLQGRRRRYPSPRAMLDAYRREKQARRQAEVRTAKAKAPRSRRAPVPVATAMRRKQKASRR